MFVTFELCSIYRFIKYNLLSKKKKKKFVSCEFRSHAE